MKKLLIWFGGAVVTAAAIWIFLVVSAGYMMSSVFPLPPSPPRISGNTRLVILPVSETFKSDGGLEPRLKIPDSIIRWIIGDTVYVNFIYSDLEKWVKSGCVGEPILRRGNNNLDDFSVEITHFSRKNPLKESINNAVNNPEKIILPSSGIEEQAGLERFHVDIKVSVRGAFGYYWISEYTRLDGTYIETLLADGQRSYIDLYSQSENIYLKTTFPEKMIRNWLDIKNNMSTLMNKWQGLPLQCKGN